MGNYSGHYRILTYRFERMYCYKEDICLSSFAVFAKDLMKNEGAIPCLIAVCRYGYAIVHW